MLKHLVYVEEDWFSRRLHGRDRQPPWDTVDWKADPDWEWHGSGSSAITPRPGKSLHEACSKPSVTEAMVCPPAQLLEGIQHPSQRAQDPAPTQTRWWVYRGHRCRLPHIS
jgi:hypothetical protein